MSNLAELEEKQAARKAERQALADAQRAVDLEAKMALEDEYADTAIASVGVSRFVSGQPTMAIVRMPKPEEYKRYLDQIHRGVDKKSLAAQRDAQTLLANSCWIYPREVEERKAMVAAFPGILTPLAVAASTLAEGKTEEEGK